jgi:hypothetical protein
MKARASLRAPFTGALCHRRMHDFSILSATVSTYEGARRHPSGDRKKCSAQQSSVVAALPLELNQIDE